MMLNHIEKVAHEHNIRVMKTDDIDSKTPEAVAFFKSMGYKLEPISEDGEFLQGTKEV